MVAGNDRPIVAQVPSAEIGKPDSTANIAASAPPAGDLDVDQTVDKRWLEMALSDAERAERDWRRRGREVVAIYRNDSDGGTSAPTGRKNARPKGQTFNILYSNTEIMLPSVYQKAPKPVVKSRFTGGSVPAMQPMGMPPGMPPMGPPPAPIAAPVPPGLPPPEMGPIPPAPVPGPGMGAPMMGGPPGMPPVTPPMSPLMIGNPAPDRPQQKDIETAAAIVQKSLEIVLADEDSDAAVKTAIKDVMLPGRGVCRVRWKPVLVDAPPIETPESLDPMGAGQAPGANVAPSTKKVWEEVGDEYVYWEDLLLDPVRQHGDTQWIAFRHLFTKEQLTAEFQGQPEFDRLVQLGKLDTLLQWTEESAAKSPPAGGGYQKTAQQQGDVIRKAMVWEVWDKVQRRIIWYIREGAGLVLRVDPDSLDLTGFYPIPSPMLSVITSDSRIPKPFYDLYANLANDLEETSKRISKLTEKIKVRGGYNSASNEIADILTADDGKMIPVEGVDMLNGGLNAHIWLVPIDVWVAALRELITTRENIKQAIYEVMGISDIMRGATKASETATAQRIKGTMGTVRLQEQRDGAANFARDLMRLKAEIICKNFDAATLEKMTGEMVTPEVEAILRSDFTRTCTIDIETDSTVEIDEQQEQQSMAMTMQSIQAVMMGAQGLLATGILPPQQVIMLCLQLLKMALHPIRYSRGVVQLIDDFTAQLMAQMLTQPPVPPGPPGGAGPEAAAGPPEPRGQPPGQGMPNSGPPPPNGNGIPPGTRPN